jgi:hypothetical protein
MYQAIDGRARLFTNNHCFFLETTTPISSRSDCQVTRKTCRLMARSLQKETKCAGWLHFLCPQGDGSRVIRSSQTVSNCRVIAVCTNQYGGPQFGRDSSALDAPSHWCVGLGSQVQHGKQRECDNALWKMKRQVLETFTKCIKKILAELFFRHGDPFSQYIADIFITSSDQKWHLWLS